jgi:nucleotide-binding universal stress UspA family protein
MPGTGFPDVHVPASGPPVIGGGASFRRILVPVDPFGRCAAAMTLAGRLSLTVGGVLRLIHVRAWDPPARGGMGRFYLQTSEEATALLDTALTGLWACGAAASGMVLDAPRPLTAAAIAAEASSWRADVMVVARRRRRALGVLLFGSLSDQVMQETQCPVLVVRQVRSDPWSFHGGRNAKR